MEPTRDFAVDRITAFAILCALEVCQEEPFVKWAKSWLDGTDRTEESARKAGTSSGAANAAVYSSYAKTCREVEGFDSTRESWAENAVRNATKEKAIDRAALMARASTY